MYQGSNCTLGVCGLLCHFVRPQVSQSGTTGILDLIILVRWHMVLCISDYLIVSIDQIVGHNMPPFVTVKIISRHYQCPLGWQWGKD